MTPPPIRRPRAPLTLALAGIGLAALLFAAGAAFFWNMGATGP